MNISIIMLHVPTYIAQNAIKGVTCTCYLSSLGLLWIHCCSVLHVWCVPFLQVFYHLLIASFWAILYYFFSSQCMLFHNLTNHHHSCHHHCHHCHCHHCKHHHHYKGYERTIRFKVASKLLININFAIFFPSVLPILSSAYQFLILQIISLLLSWLMQL